MAFDAGAIVGRVNLETGEFTANMQGAIDKSDKMTQSMLGAQIQFALLEKAIGAVTGLLKNSVGAWIAQEDAIAQTEARLKSTGYAAGLTKDELTGLSEAMQEQTTYADDDVLAMENLLLTFTKVKGDTFKGAVSTILDMSTALGQDLKSGAVQVGKALQDPILGITALRRVGVNFTESQKEMIQELLRAGKTEEAQALILKELQVEFGGAAAAAKNTLGGALKSLNNDLGDVQESIGQALAPVLRDLVDWIKPAVTWLKNIDQGTVKTAIAFMGMVAATFAVGKAIQAVSNMLKAGITPLQVVLMAMAAVGAIVASVNEAFARARTIHGELAESYMKEYEAIDGQVSRYDQLKNKVKLSTDEKGELIKIEHALKRQLGEESAFVQDQAGKWTVNANAVAKYKRERLDLAIRELKAQEVVSKGENKWAQERENSMKIFRQMVKMYGETTAQTLFAGEKIRLGFGLLDDAAKMELFTIQELTKTGDKLTEVQGQLNALQTEGVKAALEYKTGTNGLNTAQLQNTEITDEQAKAQKTLAELLHENSLEFMTDKEREIAALNERVAIMRANGATEAQVTDYYAKKMADINKKYADEAVRAWQEATEAISGAVSSIVTPVGMAWGAIEGVWSQALQNEQTALENDYEKKKAAIEANVTDEEARAEQLAALDAEYDKKRAALKKKQWVADKASNIANAIMNTAMAVTSALAVFPPWVGIALAAVVGALGAAQVALIAAEPMPEFAMGGTAPAGSMALVGEQGPEIVQFNRTARVYSNADSQRMLGTGGDFNANFYGDINNDVDVTRALQMAGAQYRAARRGAA